MGCFEVEEFWFLVWLLVGFVLVLMFDVFLLGLLVMFESLEPRRPRRRDGTLTFALQGLDEVQELLIKRPVQVRPSGGERGRCGCAGISPFFEGRPCWIVTVGGGLGPKGLRIKEHLFDSKPSL